VLRNPSHTGNRIIVHLPRDSTLGPAAASTSRIPFGPAASVYTDPIPLDPRFLKFARSRRGACRRRIGWSGVNIRLHLNHGQIELHAAANARVGCLVSTARPMPATPRRFICLYAGDDPPWRVVARRRAAGRRPHE